MNALKFLLVYINIISASSHIKGKFLSHLMSAH